MRIYSTNKLTIRSGVSEVKFDFTLPYTDTKLVGAMIECNPQLEVELIADEYISTDCGFTRIKIAGKAGVIHTAEAEYIDMNDLYEEETL